MLYNTLNPEQWQDPDSMPAQQQQPAMPMFGQPQSGGFLGLDRQSMMALAMGLLSESGPNGDIGRGLARGLQGVQAARAQAADNEWKAANFGLENMKYQSGREDRQVDQDFKEKEFNWKVSDAAFDKELKRQGVGIDQRKILLEEKKYKDELDNQAKFRSLIEGKPAPSQPQPSSTSPEAQYGPPMPPGMQPQQPPQQSAAPAAQQQGGIFSDLDPAARNIALAYSYSGKDGIGKAVEVAEKNRLTPKDIMDQEGGLRKEYDGISKDYKQVVDAWSNIQVASKDPSGAGDIALTHSFLKLLDPGATVRPNQMADAQNASGVPERIREEYNRLLTGQRLSPESRQAFISKANDIFEAQSQNNKATETSYREIAKRNKLNPDNIIVNYRQPASNGPASTGAAGGPSSQGVQVGRYNPRTRRIE